MVDAVFLQPQTPSMKIWSNETQSPLSIANKLLVVRCAAIYLIFVSFGEREIVLVNVGLLTLERLEAKREED